MNKDDFEKYWGKEHAYCIMNHTYEIDWLIGWMICDKIHLLGVSNDVKHSSIKYFMFYICN